MRITSCYVHTSKLLEKLFNKPNPNSQSEIFQTILQKWSIKM